jgi:hypothetical protein
MSAAIAAAAAAASAANTATTQHKRRSAGSAAVKHPPAAKPPFGSPLHGRARGSQPSLPSTSATGFGVSALSATPFQGHTSTPFASFPSYPQQPSFAQNATHHGVPTVAASGQNQVFVFGGQAPAAPFAASSHPSRHASTTASNQPSQTGGTRGATAPYSSTSAAPEAHVAYTTGAPQRQAVSATSNVPDSTQNSSTANTNPEASPQDDQEARLLSETLAMGFKDPAEILISIRKLAAANGGQQLTADVVMCDVVHAREEAEFARQMDLARLASERDRRKDAEARRKANALVHEERLLTACPTAWIESKEMFQSSWLLRSSCRDSLLSHVNRRPSELKRHLVEVLKLEKKSRQWYGQELPSYYFDGVLSERLRIIKDYRTLETALKQEVDTLRDGLMLLSNQDGNAPLVFLEAKEEWKLRHGEEDDDDDDVILLETRRPTQASQRAETIETS